MIQSLRFKLGRICLFTTLAVAPLVGGTSVATAQSPDTIANFHVGDIRDVVKDDLEFEKELEIYRERLKRMTDEALNEELKYWESEYQKYARLVEQLIAQIAYLTRELDEVNRKLAHDPNNPKLQREARLLEGRIIKLRLRLDNPLEERFQSGEILREIRAELSRRRRQNDILPMVLSDGSSESGEL